MEYFSNPYFIGFVTGFLSSAFVGWIFYRRQKSDNRNTVSESVVKSFRSMVNQVNQFKQPFLPGAKKENANVATILETLQHQLETTNSTVKKLFEIKEPLE